MTNGETVPSVVDSIRVQDPQTGAWLPLVRKGGDQGELWVDDFNTKDLVEISEDGKHMCVLGVWCSVLEIEEQIMRNCMADLLQQALVIRNTKSMRVLIAVFASMWIHFIILYSQE